jgi:hypothetical protein
MYRVIKKGLPSRRNYLLNIIKYLRIYLFIYNNKLYNHLREERTKKRTDLRDPLYVKIYYRISRFIISKVKDYRRFYNLKDQSTVLPLCIGTFIKTISLLYIYIL